MAYFKARKRIQKFLLLITQKREKRIERQAEIRKKVTKYGAQGFLLKGSSDQEHILKDSKSVALQRHTTTALPNLNTHLNLNSSRSGVSDTS